MTASNAREEYLKALRAGQKNYKESGHPDALDDIFPGHIAMTVIELPETEIPLELVVGVVSASRGEAFSRSFMPLQDPASEFAAKWIALCGAHLEQEGVQDPIACYEYLGRFYVIEGNKRVSVLKHFGASKVSALVKRILPERSAEPRIAAYYEFLEFYRRTGLYDIQYTVPGSYAKLLAKLGKEPGEDWTGDEVKYFTARFHSFRRAFETLPAPKAGDPVTAETALLKWLEIYHFKDIGDMTSAGLAESLKKLRDDLAPVETPPVETGTLPVKTSKGLIESILAPDKSHLAVAFIHQGDAASSLWTKAHSEGVAEAAAEFGDRITVREYFHADDPEAAEDIIEEAVSDGAELVFTTVPALLRPTLKAHLAHPAVRFFNCSPDISFSGVRGYYFRAYEGKFITGAIAGAMSHTGRIGYIASYPILGVTASINAFALGAQLTNPEAEIMLRWSCVEGNHMAEMASFGADVVSNRDVPTPSPEYIKYGEFGTYLITDGGALRPLGSPVWLWGKFYIQAINAALTDPGGMARKDADTLNYWLGMDSGVVDITLAEDIPDGAKALADLLLRDFRAGKLDPFYRKITAQGGKPVSDGTRHFTAEEILHMDWLCHNVRGVIPAFDEIREISKPLVRAIGIYKDSIPPEKETGA